MNVRLNTLLQIGRMALQNDKQMREAEAKKNQIERERKDGVYRQMILERIPEELREYCDLADFKWTFATEPHVDVGSHTPMIPIDLGDGWPLCYADVQDLKANYGIYDYKSGIDRFTWLGTELPIVLARLEEIKIEQEAREAEQQADCEADPGLACEGEKEPSLELPTLGDYLRDHFRPFVQEIVEEAIADHNSARISHIH